VGVGGPHPDFDSRFWGQKPGLQLSRTRGCRQIYRVDY